MRHFLSEDRTVDKILVATQKQHIWRGAHAVTDSFANNLRDAFPFCKTPRKRLLLFLRSAGFWVDGENVALQQPASGAQEAIRECGTPVKLLVAYYQNLDVKLVLMHGSNCFQTWEPINWEQRKRADKLTVIINVWNHHVSTYNSCVADSYPEPKTTKWSPVELAMQREEADEDFYDKMEEFDWLELTAAMQAKRSVVFWTTLSAAELESGLQTNDVSYVPHYTAPGRLNLITIQIWTVKQVEGKKDQVRKDFIRIRRVPEYFESDDGRIKMGHVQLSTFCKTVQTELRLKLFYKGESEAVVGDKFVEAFLTTKRQHLAAPLEKELRDKQDNRCALCGDRLTHSEAHHDPPVSEGGTNEDIVLVCRTCHAEETEKLQLKGGTSPQFYQSQLGPDMMEAFQTTPRPRQLCWGDPKMQEQAKQSDGFTQADLFCMDVVGCRSNALLSRKWLPVGTPLDCFRPVFTGRDEDDTPLKRFAWLWVETEGRHTLYDGPHLYPWLTVRVLIEEGFLVAIADTLPFGWHPLKRFPSSQLADAWANARRCGATKSMILATIGLWSKQERFKYLAKRTDCEADMPGPVAAKLFREDSGTIMFCKSEIYDNRTCLPFALLPLFDEQRLMYKAMRLAAKVPQIVVLGCMVDGLFCTGPPEAKAALMSVCQSEKYPTIEDTNVFQFKDAVYKQLASLPVEQKRDESRPCFKPPTRLRSYIRESDPQALEELQSSFTFGKNDPDRPASLFKRCDAANGSESILATIGKAFTQPLDKFQALAIGATIINRGALFTGAAGVGKSQVLRALKATLESMGQKVITCAYTHAATRLIGGETVAHLLHLNTRLADTWFLVDEIGLLPLSTLGDISRWCSLGAKFVFFGDYSGQFGPLRDRWNLPLCPEHSPFMGELANGLYIELSTYRRGADLELFNWFHSMYGQEEVQGLVHESRRRYPAACDPYSDPLILCLSHNYRERINTVQNTRLAPENALLLEWEGGSLRGATAQPQTMRVWPGITLIGCPRGSGKELVVQGVVYYVTNVTETHLELQMLPDYCHGRKDEQVSVPIEEACAQLRPAHAMCYYTVQGRTIRDRHVVLLDCGHKHMSVRALIVGLSRVTHGSFAHIGDSQSESLFCGPRRVRQQKP